MQTLLIAFGLYLLYKFIFGFLIPVITTTRKVKQQFSSMKEKMEQTINQQQATSQEHIFTNKAKQATKTTSGKVAPKDDYIDYEEVK
jgi:hypothetical protein